jgi:putative transposase
MILGLVDEALASGACMRRVCIEIGLDATTLMRWRRQGIGDDRHAGPRSPQPNKLTAQERQLVVETACSLEFRDLSPKQIVP